MKAKSKFFPYLLGFSTFLIAASAAFFSVFGLSKLFAGASLSVIVMAGSLELGKVLGISFLYQYWQEINKLIRTYLLIGTVVLVFITSMGIFGFLSNAYQGATTTFEKESTQLMLLEEQLESAKLNKIDLLAERDEQVSSYPDNFATKRREIRNIYSAQIITENTSINDLTTKVSDLKIKLIDSGVDVGPAIYIARAFDTSVDTVVKWFIFILIFVFDPFAVSLVIATNIALTKARGDLPEIKIDPKDPEAVWNKERKKVFFPKNDPVIEKPAKNIISNIKEKVTSVISPLPKKEPIKPLEEKTIIKKDPKENVYGEKVLGRDSRKS